MVIVVEIEDRTGEKPFLGGWRDSVTKVEYHNAMTQTRPRDPKTSHDRLNTRETQTVSVADKSIATLSDKITQVVGNQASLPDISDKLLVPGKFEPAEESSGAPSSLQLEKNAVKIQKFYRAYRSRMLVKRCAKFFRNMVRKSPDYGKTWQMPLKNRRQLEIVRPKPPETRGDFDMLYNMVDRWRCSEVERANRVFFRSSRLTAHCQILRKEIELLQAIDGFKARVKRAARTRRDLDFLNRQTRPITWVGYKGKPVSMVTLRVQRSREHKKTYDSLSENNVTVGERASLLLTLKESMRSHGCASSGEIVYLIDQELDLLSRDVGPGTLDHLRNRLKFAFLHFVRSAEFCSSKCVVEGLHESEEATLAATRFCRMCRKLLPVGKFSIDRHRRLFTCKDCERLQPRTNPQIFYEPYECMLRGIRRSEVRMKCYSSVAFVIGPVAIYHLVNNIWHGKSGISECDDMNQLRLVRFKPGVEWAPWNSLVLTWREASMHATIASLEEVYSDELLKKFSSRNLQAKFSFESMSEFRKQLARRGEGLHREESCC